MRKIIIAFLLSLNINLAYSQGCSDAGFCTVNGSKPKTDSVKSTNNEIIVGFSYGKADYNITTNSVYLDYRRSVNQSLSFNLRLTSMNQSGNSITNSGLSDAFITSNFKLNSKIGLTSGFKLPFNNGNQIKNNFPLPLDYQSSLGTIDFLFGINASFHKLQIVGGWQQPITQNKNEFLSEIYPPNSTFNEFQSTNNFIRAGDVLLRLSYPIKISKKLTLSPGLLSIYHLGKDYYTAINGKKFSTNGSDGLTLNSNFYLDYKLNNKNYIQLNGGIPFIVRKTRPDGLTRSLVVSIEFKHTF